MSHPLLALENVHFAYAGQLPLYENLSFAVHAGEKIGLYGANGQGKTTLLRLLTGLEKPQQGALFFQGQEIKTPEQLHFLRCHVGFVLQNSDDQLFCPTVLDDVAFGPLNLGLEREQAKQRALETLEELQLSAYASRSPYALSGGEKKLVALASVLAMQPQVLLLDEPTAFLDSKAQERVLELVESLPLSIVLVSHDPLLLAKTRQLAVPRANVQ